MVWPELACPDAMTPPYGVPSTLTLTYTLVPVESAAFRLTPGVFRTSRTTSTPANGPEDAPWALAAAAKAETSTMEASQA